MPSGHNIAKCLCCLKEWIVGDCIPSVCPDCEGKGHNGGLFCPACKLKGEPKGDAIRLTGDAIAKLTSERDAAVRRAEAAEAKLRAARVAVTEIKSWKYRRSMNQCSLETYAAVYDEQWSRLDASLSPDPQPPQERIG